MAVEEVEIAAALVGAGISAVVAVVVFVLDRVVARRAAYVERRRVAFDAVLISFSTYVAAALAAKGQPEAKTGAQLVTSRARLLLSLRVKDRPLGWWLSGMERRLGEAAGTLDSEWSIAVERLEALNSNVANTLIDLHSGRVNERDLLLPASLFWAESEGLDVRAEFPDDVIAAERPERMGQNHGFAPWLLSVWTKAGLATGRWLGVDTAYRWVDRRVRSH